MNLITECFILFTIFFLWYWPYEEDHPVKRFFVPYKPIIRYFGFNHRWSLFAPNSISGKFKLEVVYILKNSEKIVKTFPQDYIQNYSQRHLLVAERLEVSKRFNLLPGFIMYLKNHPTAMLFKDDIDSIKLYLIRKETLPFSEIDNKDLKIPYKRILMCDSRKDV